MPAAAARSSGGSSAASRPTRTESQAEILERRPIGPGRGTDPRAEAELAERLDTVLGIAGRLAASHDRETLIRMIVDETRRGCGPTPSTIRMLRDERLEVTAWTGCPMSREPPAGPPARRGLGRRGPAHGHVLAFPDIRAEGQYGHARYDGIPEIAGHLAAPLVHNGRVIGALSALSGDPRAWTSGDVAFISTLATHAAIALANAELFEQTVARAAQLEVLQTASARMSRAVTVEEVARTVVEETHGIIDYHNARVYLVELPDAVVPIAFEGRLGAYEHVDMALLECRLGEGFTGWVAQHGEPILLNDTNHDPRGATIAGTEDIDESMLVVPMRYDGATIGVITLSKLGLDGFGSDDLRLLTILADRAATAIGSVRLLTRAQGLALELRRLLDMSGELSGSLDPHQVAEVMAGHLARAMGVGECIISYWDRDAGRVESLGYYPAHRIRDIEPSYEVGGLPADPPRPRAPGEVIVDVDDPVADPAEVELMRRDGNGPGDAAAGGQGPVDRARRAHVRRPGHVRRRAPRRSPGRWPTRRRWRSRTRGSTRRPGSWPTATR